MNIEQWTVKFKDVARKQFALIKVRFSKFFSDLIEVDVELSQIPVQDKKGKDVSVYWKIYDGFDGNKTFWTDSNGLEMQKRKINYRPLYNITSFTKNNISSNFYPVTSAIALRDSNS
jgi:lysosomal alpha-mannosidase